MVLCHHASPVLEPAEHPLDEITLLVDLRIEGLKVLAGGVVGDDGRPTAFDQELAHDVTPVSHPAITRVLW